MPVTSLDGWHNRPHQYCDPFSFDVADMQIELVSEVLKPLGLGLPRLSALTPDVNNYRACLLQPHGDIEAGAFGVRHKDRPRASAEFEAFLRSANSKQAELVVTPEYSMPWEVLTAALNSGLQPRPGDLWVLGCESITYSDLMARKEQLGAVHMLFEPLAEQPGRFLDPLAYVFHAPQIAKPEATELVVLVQFKTHPMADPDHFEVAGMQRGTTVYQFDRREDSIRLVSFICSDALDLSDEVTARIYKSALVIHIQLNPDPRNVSFRRYRDGLLRFEGDETELICLNWASNVTCSMNGASHAWANIAGSAWYLRPEQFDLRDAALSHNHSQGLYYTWLKPSRFHALFFNYDAAAFVMEASKVSHFQVGAVSSRRLGPKLLNMLTWHAQQGSWTQQGTPQDGFATIANEAGGAQADVEAVAAGAPFAAERLLALSTGMAGTGVEWHTPKKLDSCGIESDEVIKRITFCQDSNTAAARFRVGRLRGCRELARILGQPGLPVRIQDFESGFNLEWTAARPHQNARSSAGRHATVIYAGEAINLPGVEAIYRNAENNLHRASNSADESVEAVSRLVVWYREDGQTKSFAPDAVSKIDKADRESPVDIARADT